MSKHFLVNPYKEEIDKQLVKSLREESERLALSSDLRLWQENETYLSNYDDLIHVDGRVIIKLDINNKNSWTFSNGTKIRYERQFDNFNRRHTEPVNAIVISGEDIPKGSEILIHHNAVTEQYLINDYKEDNPNIKYYSIPQEMCFAYYNKGWIPMKPFEFALQVYQPYKGFVQGIEPNIIQDTLFVTTGDLKNKVVKTLKASNYIIVFQDKNGQESQLLRFRPHGDGKEREPEAICLMDELTKKVLSGELLIGLSTTNCKKIQEIFPNDRP